MALRRRVAGPEDATFQCKLLWPVYLDEAGAVLETTKWKADEFGRLCLLRLLCML
jgi:hypothetical protein